MKRVFSAVDIESSRIQARLEEVMGEVDHGFRPVPPEKMHLTFQFFQEVDEEDVEKIKEAMDKTTVKPFTASVEGLGVFPSKDYIRVLWAGVEADPLYTLKEQLSNHGAEADNNHDFRPHISLFRVEGLGRIEKKEVHQALERYRGEKIADLEVDSVKLFESEMTENGSKYRELYEKEL